MESVDNSNSNEYLTISEAEELTDIPNATLKRYMFNHDDFVDYRKEGREYRVSVNSIELLKQIRAMYNEGYKKDRVNEVLTNEGHPVTITMHDVQESDAGTALVNLNEDIEAIKRAIVQQIKNDEDVAEHNRLLQVELSEVRKQMNDMQAFQEQQAKEQAEATKALQQALDEAKEANKGGWLSKLFRNN